MEGSIENRPEEPRAEHGFENACQMLEREVSRLLPGESQAKRDWYVEAGKISVLRTEHVVPDQPRLRISFELGSLEGGQNSEFVLMKRVDGQYSLKTQRGGQVKKSAEVTTKDVALFVGVLHRAAELDQDIRVG